MINVIMADDHAIVRRGLRQIVDECDDIKVIDEVDNGLALIDKVKKNKYDVVVCDMNMPGKTGLEVIEELMQYDSEMNILVLSVHSEKQLIMGAIKLGAKGYVSKDTSLDELVDAIRRISNGGRYLSRGIAEKVVLNIAEEEKNLPHEALSVREYETLVKIGMGKTVKEISDELNLSPKTISTYRSRILEKMNMKSNLEMIRYVLKHGLNLQ